MSDYDQFVRDNALVLIGERDLKIKTYKDELKQLNHAHDQHRALIRRLREQVLSLGVEPVG